MNRIPKKEGRAKHLRIEVNKKRIDLPRKAAQISRDDSIEVSMFRSEFDDTLVSEFVLQVRPKTLRDLVASPSKHQSVKDAIRNRLSDTGDKAINIAYPYLINHRSSSESEDDFLPFEKPTKKHLEKLFDVFDIEGFDILILPVSSSNGEGFEWVRIATEVFKNREPDYLNEYILSGLIRRNVTETNAVKMAKHYLKNGIESLSFDFELRKVPETRMKNVIDGIGKQWGDLHIHGTNVPHFDWYGTWRKPVLTTYDLLVSVYGFDSFANLRRGISGGATPPKKIKDKMQRKRYRLIETYGTYDFAGLSRILQTQTVDCKGPICRKTKPLDIYAKPTSNDGLEQLGAELKTHRLYSTHKEMNIISGMIDKDKYTTHIKSKKEASKEVSSMLSHLE